MNKIRKMGETTFLILFLLGVVSCTTLPVANDNIVVSSTAPVLSNLTKTSTPMEQVTASPTLMQEMTPTENKFGYPNLKPGQYILYQIEQAGKVELSALSPYTGETYSLYDVGLQSDLRLSSTIKHLAIVKLEQVEMIDLETGITQTVKFDYVCSSGTWSPDDSKLALTCGQVFIVSFPDLNIFQLTELPSNFDRVSWSPDGKWLAYVNVADPYGDDPHDGIYVTDTACLLSSDICKEQTRFSDGLFYQFVASTWSLDSSQLAFLALGNIYKLETSTMKINLDIELPHENISDTTGLAWSPDESQYAISNEITRTIKVISSKDGKEAASYPIAGTVLSWITVH